MENIASRRIFILIVCAASVSHSKVIHLHDSSPSSNSTQSRSSNQISDKTSKESSNVSPISTHSLISSSQEHYTSTDSASSSSESAVSSRLKWTPSSSLESTIPSGSKSTSSSSSESAIPSSSHSTASVSSESSSNESDSSSNETDSVSATRYATIPTNAHFLKKIQLTVTRSRDAVWATVTLTFLCVLLVLAVAQSKMWRGYQGSEAQGIPLPNFNEKVLFKDVMERKVKTLKMFFQKHKKKKKESEIELLLPTSEWD